MRGFLDRLNDFEIMDTFDTVFRDIAVMNDVGNHETTVERVADGCLLRLRIASMIDKATVEDFKGDPDRKREPNLNLSVISVPFVEAVVNFKAVEAVSVSGMEIEVVYEPQYPDVVEESL